MSTLKAKIQTIEYIDSLHFIKFKFENTLLSIILLELPYNISIGTEVILNIKPTHIAIGKSKIDDISYSNQIEAQIEEIEIGKILTRVTLKTKNNSIFESIITTNSSKRLGLEKDQNVIAFIKSTDISIGEKYYD